MSRKVLHAHIRAVAGAAVVVCICLLFSTCSFSAVFGAYSGVNLIASTPFDATDWVPDQNSTYLTYQAVSASVAGGTSQLPSGTSSNIYRLEINNLVPDGDFEADTIGATSVPNWSFSAHNAKNSSGSIIAGSMFGHAFSLDVPDYNSVAFDLTSLADGFKTAAVYQISFDYTVNASQIRVEYSDNQPGGTFFKYWTSQKETGSYASFPSISELDNTIVATTAGFGPYFTIGSSITTPPDYGVGGVTATIDDVRIVRSDVPLRLRLAVPVVDPNKKRLTLLDGTYVFSVWVKTDPTNTETGTGTKVNNRFPATAVTLGASHLANGTRVSTEAPIVYTPSTSSSGNWDNWTELKWQVSGMQVTIPGTPQNQCSLELNIAAGNVATGSNSLTAGSILIAAPSLVYAGD